MEQPDLNSSEQPFKDDREKKNLSSDQSPKPRTERGCSCTLNTQMVLTAFGDKLNGN